MEKLNINFKILFIEQNIFNRELQSNRNINVDTSEMFVLSSFNTNFEFKNQNNRNFQNYNILLFGNEDKALEYLKQLKFIEVIIIVADSLFNNFVKKLKNNLNYICVIPRIIIFNRGRNIFSMSNICLKCCEKKEDEFYHCGGNTSSFDEIYNYINNLKEQNILQNNTIFQYNQLNRSIMKEGNYLFEQIRKKEDLILFFCKNCPVGHCSGVGASYCELCPLGTYADYEGTAICKSCEENYHSNDDRTGCISDCSSIYLKQNWYIVFILILLNIF